MFLRLYKYLRKDLMVLSVVAVLGAMALLNTGSYEGRSFDSYQHPYLTTLIVALYLLTISKLNITDSMFVMRFPNRTQCMVCTIGSLCLFSWGYYSALFACCLLLCQLMTAAVWSSSMVLCYVFTNIALIIINIFYVVLSFKWGGLPAHILLYSILFLFFAVNFSSEFFARYNFFYFNMYTALNRQNVTDALTTYAGLTFVLTLLLQKKDKEL